MTALVIAGLAALSAALFVRQHVGRRHHVAATARTSLAVDLVSRLRGRLTTRRSLQRRREIARDAVAAMAAELSAGHSATRALERAFARDDLAPRSRAAIAWGGDVVEALRADARMPGCGLLLAVSACWSVAHGTGAGLAESLRRAVSADREDDEVRTQLAAHLAAPRATARMLAGLPVLGLILGIAMGGDPLAWLLGTPLGFGCLACGIGLTILGLLWTSRIAARVEALL